MLRNAICMLIVVVTFAVCAITYGCQSSPSPSLAYQAPVEIPRLPDGVERVKIGACWYVIVRGNMMLGGSGNPGIAITHAADCPNHWWAITSDGHPLVTTTP